MEVGLKFSSSTSVRRRKNPIPLQPTNHHKNEMAMDDSRLSTRMLNTAVHTRLVSQWSDKRVGEVVQHWKNYCSISLSCLALKRVVACFIRRQKLAANASYSLDTNELNGRNSDGPHRRAHQLLRPYRGVDVRRFWDASWCSRLPCPWSRRQYRY
jgi:hypothetical protein